MTEAEYIDAVAAEVDRRCDDADYTDVQRVAAAAFGIASVRRAADIACDPYCVDLIDDCFVDGCSPEPVVRGILAGIPASVFATGFVHIRRGPGDVFFVAKMWHESCRDSRSTHRGLTSTVS